MLQLQPNIQLENQSLQPNGNIKSNHNQNDLQNPKLTFDYQITAHTLDSITILVTIRLVIEQHLKHSTQHTSILSSNKTTITQPQIKPTTSENYDPPPPPKKDTSTSSSTSQQTCSSINIINGLITNTRPQFTFRSPSTPRRSSVTTHPYTPAQNTTATNIPTKFNINMLHTKPPPKIDTSRTLTRPSISLIPTNTIQCKLSSTNIHNTQHSVYPLVHNTQDVTSNTTIQNNNVAVPSGSSIRTNRFVTPKTQIPRNTNNLQTNTSHSNYHTTHPSAQPLTTISTNPTHINSSASSQNQSNQLMVFITNKLLKNIYNL